MAEWDPALASWLAHAGTLVSLVGLRRGAQEETLASADDSLSPTDLPVGATPTAA
jgi:hypothetical protein